jgi:hypothetical protein
VFLLKEHNSYSQSFRARLLFPRKTIRPSLNVVPYRETDHNACLSHANIPNHGHLKLTVDCVACHLPRASTLRRKVLLLQRTQVPATRNAMIYLAGMVTQAADTRCSASAAADGGTGGKLAELLALQVFSVGDEEFSSLCFKPFAV